MKETQVVEMIKKALRFSSEMENVEFKHVAGGFPNHTWKSVSAFSHRPGGGCIVFGVKEDNLKGKKEYKIRGVKDVSMLQEKMGDLVTNEMSSPIRPEYFPVEIEMKQLLAVYIPECPAQFKPCYYKPVGLPQGSCIRVGNSNRTITEDEMRKFIEEARIWKFDHLRAEGAGLNDISKEKVLELLGKMGDRTKRKTYKRDVDFDLLKNLGIADSYDEGRYPTIAGFLIFSKKKPQLKKAFSRYLVRCVRYQGSNVATDILDKADFDGTLDDQIEQMQKFVLRNIKKSASIVAAKRREKYEYPEKAIREIVANAVIHRDYKITETYTQVNIFEDRLEVSNPGCLPPGVTVDNIRDAQFSRNEIIAAVLKDLDYLEEYGRGIDIVFHEMSSSGLLPPIFKNSANSFKVILLGEKLSKLNERQRQIWEHLVEHKKVTAKACESLLLGVPRQTINYDLSRLQKLGLIHQVGESVNTRYEPNF